MYVDKDEIVQSCLTYLLNATSNIISLLVKCQINFQTVQTSHSCYLWNSLHLEKVIYIFMNELTMCERTYTVYNIYWFHIGPLICNIVACFITFYRKLKVLATYNSDKSKKKIS